MRCFIHNDAEAISVCKRCGKAMCAKCSAYSGHSGVCPECRRDDFIKERNQNNKQIEEIKKEKIRNVFWGILLFWTIIAIFVNVYRFKKNSKKIQEIEARNEKLTAEIDKLTESLNDRGTEAFI